MVSVDPLSDAADAVNDGRSKLASACARRRRGPASNPSQLRWLRRLGRCRPLGQRRHRGAVWLPPCQTCHRPSRLQTHYMAPLTDCPAAACLPVTSVCNVVTQATHALIRSGCLANLWGEELAVHVSDEGYHRIFNPQPPRPKSVENFSIHFSTHPPSGARAAWGRNVMLVNYLTHPPSGARVAWGRNVFVVYYSTHPP